MVYRWNKSSDKKLLKAIEKKGTHWVSVSKYLDKEFNIKVDPKQARERYLFHLNPKVTKRRMTDEEWAEVCRLQKIHGNSWSHISKIIPGNFSPLYIKNRWWSQKRKNCRNLSIKKQGTKRSRKSYGNLPIKKRFRLARSFEEDDSKESYDPDGSSLSDELEESMASTTSNATSNTTDITTGVTIAEKNPVSDSEYIVDSLGTESSEIGMTSSGMTLSASLGIPRGVNDYFLDGNRFMYYERFGYQDRSVRPYPSANTPYVKSVRREKELDRWMKFNALCSVADEFLRKDFIVFSGKLHHKLKNFDQHYNFFYNSHFCM